MKDAISDILKPLTMFFDCDTYDGSKNIFNNFSKMMKGLRSRFMEIGVEFGKEVFKVTSETITELRNGIFQSLNIPVPDNGSKSGTVDLPNQSKSAMNTFVGGSNPKFGSNTTNSNDDTKALTEKNKFEYDMQQQMLKSRQQSVA